MTPIRILHVVGIMNRGGIESFIMNLYRKIDREKVQFDFLVHKSEEGIFEKEILDLGGKIYRIQYVNKVGPFKYKNELRRFFKEHKEYKIVHSHMNFISGIVLREANKCGIETRISHSHANGSKYGIIDGTYKKYCKIFLNKNSNYKFACAKGAGEWLFGKNSDFKVINNGIDLDKFKYSIDKRRIMKRSLNIDSKITIGHVGRFDEPKNHIRIIEIFNEVNKLNQNIKLILVGDGKLRTEIEKKINEYDLQKNVYLLGIRNNVDEIIQTFDIMLFPSLHEGLPVTLVEAQANGLPCIVSDNITKEIDMGCGLVDFVSLDTENSIWAKKIIQRALLREEINQDIVREKIKENGYDINEVADDISKFYLEKYKKET